ncbi:MAG: hypothetical protein R3D69_11040 [Xanthobacteraceae bacterium]
MAHHVEVAIGDGIERPRIKGDTWHEDRLTRREVPRKRSRFPQKMRAGTKIFRIWPQNQNPVSRVLSHERDNSLKSWRFRTLCFVGPLPMKQFSPWMKPFFAA